MRLKKLSKLWATLVLCCLMVTTVSIGSAQTRRHRRNPQAGKKKAAKRIGIGAAIGAGAGALIGGRKGALIGAGVGAGSGGAYHVYKKRKARRHRH